MSIATRIQSMEEHISNAYDSLSKFGVAAPSNKNIENIASLVDEIYDSTPKTDYISGINLTLENTRVGKIDFKDTDTIEKIGLGATNQNGEPTPDSPQDINVVKGNQNILVQNKNLIEEVFKGYNINGRGQFEQVESSSTFDVNIAKVQAGETYILNTTTNVIAYFNEKPTTSSTSYNNAREVITATNTLTPTRSGYIAMRTATSNTTQLEKGTTATSYVPHQENNYEINLSSKNLFDKDNSNLIMNDIYINPTGYVLRASNNMKTICMPCKPNTAYVVSKVSSARFVIGSATSNTAGTSMTTGRNNFTGTQLTLTTGANDKYLFVFYYNGGADTLTEETIRNSIQIEVGSTATSYTPYFNIELCKIENYQDYIYKTSGKNLFNENNYLSNAGISYSTIVTSNNNNLFYMPVQYGKNYIISFIDKGVSGNILYGFSNDVPVMGGTCTYNVLDITTLNNYVFTPVNENNKYLCIRLNVNTTNQYKAMANIQVEVGNVATTYESYGKDNWYWHKEIEKVVLDGTENWSYQSQYSRFFIDLSNSALIGARDSSKSNYFIYGNTESVNNTFFISTASRLLIRNESISSANNFKTWLSNNNVTLYYVLNTPTETQITNATLISQLDAWYNAQSMDDITYITVDGNLPMQLKLKALKK